MKDVPRQERIEEVTDTMLKINWLDRHRFRSSLAQRGLTMPQFVVLAHLCHHQQGRAVHQIAEATQQERATMTGILDRLEQAGLVQRRRSQSDRRRWIITLTKEGSDLLQTTMRRNHNALSDALVAFDLAELDQLQRLLGKLLTALQAEREARQS